jgi:hypothetical protein
VVAAFILLALPAAEWGGVAELEASAGCAARPALLAHYRDSTSAYAAFSCGAELISAVLVRLDAERTLRAGFRLSPKGAGRAEAPSAASFRREWSSGGDTLALWASINGGSPPEIVPLIDLDLAGVRTGGRVVLFHTAPRSARSTLSVETGGAGPYRFLIGGLSAGTWEIWRGGWLEDHQAGVEPGKGALVFQGQGGGYFFRRIGR